MKKILLFIVAYAAVFVNANNEEDGSSSNIGDTVVSITCLDGIEFKLKDLAIRLSMKD